MKISGKNMERNRNFLRMQEESQTDIRKKYRKLRDSLTAQEVWQRSSVICEKLLDAAWYADAEKIYGYYPLGNEVDCLTFLKEALRDGKRVALPKTLPDCRMEFYEITSLSQVVEGRFHVMEPSVECPPMQNGGKTVVLVPGIVFDKSGNRYGYGKGYYDRYFARYPELRRMALAYEIQIAEQLVVKETDIPMERIYTECGICFCDRKEHES